MLDRLGVRVIEIGGRMHIGVWAWLDGIELRSALRVYGSDQAPIVYLDSPNVEIPDRFREYRGHPHFDREPPPLDVVAAMYQHPREPWVVRDRMLQERGWRPGTSDEEWRRELVSRIFLRARAEPEQQRAALEANQQEDRAAREAWMKEQRQLQKAWSKWTRWWAEDRQMAEAYRRRGQDAEGSDSAWMLEFASLRAIPGTGRQKRGREVFNAEKATAAPSGS